MNGRLFVIATPIGNLEDITYRAVKIMADVHAIACEDTRHSRKLLNHLQLKKTLISYFEPKEKQKIPYIMDLLKSGKDIALISDAGTPGISDPGFPLIREALKAGIQIIPIPGASAVTTALCAAGLPTHRFLFLGFPPVKKVAAKKLLHSLYKESATLIFYVPGRKIYHFLETIQEVMGERHLVIAREMTKIHEEFLRGTPSELLSSLTPAQEKGELTLLIHGY